MHCNRLIVNFVNVGTLQKHKEIEKFGMLLLSIGPLINMASCLFYNTKIITQKLNIEAQLSEHDLLQLHMIHNSNNSTLWNETVIPVRSHNSYNMQWLCTELVELLGKMAIVFVHIYTELCICID